jgi:hypothetical protein
MLFVLRKLRKTLIGSLSIRRYALYAIGEIALVVVGILIALQINNWNEWRKERSQEKGMLIELKRTIEGNCEILKRSIYSCEEMNRSSDIILSTLAMKRMFQDTLSWHFKIGRYQGGDGALGMSYAGYESIKTTGLNIIQSPSLKKELMDLFEFTMPMIRIVKERYRPHYVNYEDHIMTHFDESNIGLVPGNMETLLEDHYYRSMIKRIKNERIGIIDLMESAFEHSRNVLALIDEEIKN